MIGQWIRARAALLGVLAVMVGALAAFGAGVWWGIEHERTEQLAERTRQAEAIGVALASAIADGAQRELDLAKSLSDQEAFNTRLHKRYDDAVRTRALVAPAPALPGSAGSGSPAVGAPGGDGAGAVPLTLAAVGLWNSALAGADVPAGACLAAGATEGAGADAAACLASSGLTLDDAFTHHRRNAERERANRERHLALIEHVRVHCNGPQERARP